MTNKITLEILEPLSKDVDLNKIVKDIYEVLNNTQDLENDQRRSELGISSSGLSKEYYINRYTIHNENIKLVVNRNH